MYASAIGPGSPILKDYNDNLAVNENVYSADTMQEAHNINESIDVQSFDTKIGTTPNVDMRSNYTSRMAPSSNNNLV